MSASIRHWQPGDSIDDLTSLVHRSFSVMRRQGLPCWGVEQSLQDTWERAGRGDCLVAVRGDRLIGSMTIEPPCIYSACRWYRRMDVATIHQFAVDPSEQGQGVGQQLLSSAYAWAARQGFRELALETPAQAERLVCYYQANGFQLVSQWQKKGQSYLSVVLSRRIEEPGGQAEVWQPLHRCWVATCTSLT